MLAGLGGIWFCRDWLAGLGVFVFGGLLAVTCGLALFGRLRWF